MMQDVICLCDSDDDDMAASRPSTTTATTKKHGSITTPPPPLPKQQQPSMEAVVDLLDDDSDDEEESHKKKNHHSTPPLSRFEKNAVDVYFTTPSICTGTTAPTRCAPNTQLAAITHQSNSHKRRKRSRDDNNTNVNNKQRLPAKYGGDDDGDSSDSDGSLLFYHSSSGKEATTKQKKRQRGSTQTLDSTSDRTRFESRVSSSFAPSSSVVGKSSYSQQKSAPNASSSLNSPPSLPAPRRLYRRPDPKKARGAISKYSGDSSDSDSSILHQSSGLGTTKRKPSQRLLPSSQASSPGSIQSQASSSQASSTSCAVIENPYAKKKSPPSSSRRLPPPLSTRRQPRHQDSPGSATSSSSTSSTSSSKIVNPYASSSTASRTTTRATISTPSPNKRLVAIRNPYNTTTSPSPSSSTQPPQKVVGVVYPSLLQNSKTYPDLRARFLLAFWSYSRKLTQHSYNRPKLDQTAKKILALAFHDHPIRSLDEYCFVVSRKSKVTDMQIKNLKNEMNDQLEEGGLTTKRIAIPINACSNGKYYSIAEATLVSIFVETKQKLRRAGKTIINVDDAALSSMLSPKAMWMSLKTLLAEIDSRLQPDCPATICRPQDPDNGAAHYTNPSTRSAEYKQIEKLLVKYDTEHGTEQAYMKKHSLNKQVYFELTTLGYHRALKLQSRVFPERPGHYRCSILTRVEPRYQGICVGVDLREGGGPSKVLHRYCNRLDMTKIPYFVGTICVGDYCFFASDTNQLCPILVERKSIQDVALSIYDNRWTTQKQRMYHGQYIFGYDNCRIAYIIEGKTEKQEVTGGYIAHRKFNITRERLDLEIAKLKKEGFDVMESTSPENSMFQLSRWAQRVCKEVRDGTLKLQYTYKEFKQELAKIPKGTDFSRMAIYAKEEREKAAAGATTTAMTRQVAYAAAAAASVSEDITTTSDYDDFCIEVTGPSSKSYNPNSNKTKSNAHRNSTTKTKGTLPSAAARGLVPGREQATQQQEAGDYSSWSTAQLQTECTKYGLPKTGTKAVLIGRLNGPRPPRVWLERKQRGEYVPRTHDCGATALCVALLLMEQELQATACVNANNIDQHPGFEKDDIYMKAEELCITKNPFSGGTTQTGPYHYDGWANMKHLLVGDPPLVVKKRNRFKLTRRGGTSGYPLAKALHEWCHEYNHCSCGRDDSSAGAAWL